MRDKYINKSDVMKKLNYIFRTYGTSPQMKETFKSAINSLPYTVKTELETRLDSAADVQPVKYCRMIPIEPDLRGHTELFACTNCHKYIHMGLIRKEYEGNYCLECGAKVENGGADDESDTL